MTDTSTHRSAAAGTTAGPVHLTRRGRAMLLMALVAVVFAAFSLGRTASQVVSQIRRLNDLSGSQLQVGQQLLLPIAA